MRVPPGCPAVAYTSIRTTVITILIVDDDESLGDTISVLLEQEGFHAVHAADGRSGASSLDI